MSAVWTVFLLLCSMPYASGQEGSESRIPPGLREMQREVTSLREELEPLLERLKSMTKNYPQLGDLEEIEAERENLRRRLKDGGERLDRLYVAQSGLQLGGLAIEMQEALSEGKESRKAATGGERPELAGARRSGEKRRHIDSLIGGAITTQNFSIRTLDVERDIRGQLKKDQDAFDSARRVLEKKRVRRYAGLAVSLALLIVLLAAYALLRPDAQQRSAPPSGPIPAALGAPPGLPLPSVRASSSPPVDITADGRVLGGNFQVIRELGRGGMGLVYEALDLTLRRKVAIKQMREELCQSPRELELFLAEARVVAELRHPNIVEIHGAVREGGRIFLVFEYVAGRPLSRLLEERPLPMRHLKGVLAQAAPALDYAHSRRVIHRDLKPSNIMITDQRGVKVMDFGLAHRAKLSAARFTQARAQGTAAYMAPEQELGSVSRESDLYSLGVCLYEMAVGKLPFPGPNLLAQKQELFFVRPSQAADLPAAFDAVIERALQPEPSRRFHSAAELAAALGAVADA